MSITFSELSENRICSNKQYELETGNKLIKDSINNTEVLLGDTVDNLALKPKNKNKTSKKSKINKSKEIKKQLYNENSDVNKLIKTEDTKKGIGILQTAPIHTNNSFIAATQKNVQDKIKMEIERLSQVDTEFPYKAVPILTQAELQLFNFMKNNLCQIERIEILPKVRLGDIVELDKRITTDMKYYWKVTNKHVDYLICKKDTMEVICAVELDDYTHETQEAKDRDLFVMQVLQTVGIKTARITKKICAIEISDLELVNEYINLALAPKCAYCGSPMFPKKGRDGHRFYACGDFINCRRTINIDPRGEKLP